jgi:hypothetical protein
LVVASAPFFFGSDDKGSENNSVLGADISVDITGKSVSAIQNEIQTAIDSVMYQTIAVTGTKTDATEKLTLGLPSGVEIEWKAEYKAIVVGTALELILNEDTNYGFLITAGGSIGLTSTGGDPAMIIRNGEISVIEGTLNVTGDVLMDGEYTVIGSRGEYNVTGSRKDITINGDLIFSDIGRIMLSFGGEITINGNVVFDNGSCIIYSIDNGKITITEGLTSAGALMILNDRGELTVNSNLTSFSSINFSSMFMNDNPKTLINGNVTADWLLIYSATAVINGTLTLTNPDWYVIISVNSTESMFLSESDYSKPANKRAGYGGYREYTDGTSFLYVGQYDPLTETTSDGTQDGTGLSFDDPAVIGVIVAVVMAAAVMAVYFLSIRKR